MFVLKYEVDYFSMMTEIDLNVKCLDKLNMYIRHLYLSQIFVKLDLDLKILKPILILNTLQNVIS